MTASYSCGPAGPQGHAGEVAELAGLASDQMDASSFFSLVQTPGKFKQALVARLAHLKDLVSKALTAAFHGSTVKEAERPGLWLMLRSDRGFIVGVLPQPDTTELGEVPDDEESRRAW